jgi:hypothetical protein
MTRIPVSFSRITWFTRSTRTCIDLNSGMAFRSMSPMMTAITGTTTAMSPESGTSWRTAMMTPPMAMNGASTMTLRPMTTTIWTCWTSLVVRVISEGAPNVLSSASENRCTW